MIKTHQPQGPKRALTSQNVHRIKALLEFNDEVRDLALFDMGLDSKLRACDLVRIRVSDILINGEITNRARVIQKKTGRPVRFEITGLTKQSVNAHIAQANLNIDDWLFPSRKDRNRHLSTRQYANRLKGWVSSAGLDKTQYGTHSMRRTKASIIYSQTKNIRAIQLLLGHTKVDNTIRYLGIDEEDALTLAENTVI